MYIYINTHTHTHTYTHTHTHVHLYIYIYIYIYIYSYTIIDSLFMLCLLTKKNIYNRHWVVGKIRATKDLNLINEIKNLNLLCFNFQNRHELSGQPNTLKIIRYSGIYKNSIWSKRICYGCFGINYCNILNTYI